MSANNRTSVLVSHQVPSFVRDHHETFVSFLEYYYKFLEQDGQTLYVSKNYPRFLDVDIIAKDVLEDVSGHEGTYGVREETSYHQFLQMLYDSYIRFIPDNILADRNLILKHAKDFYRSRGSEKSVRFLTRALFNKESEFYYPKLDVLKASDGKWFVEKVLRVQDIFVGEYDASGNVVNYITEDGAIGKFKNHTLFGANSNASAVVESTNSFYQNGKLIRELKLSGIVGTFDNGEQIYVDFEEEGTQKRIVADLYSGIVESVYIQASGSGYSPGTIIPLVANTGSGALLVIGKVSSGSIRSFVPVYGGAGFRVNDSISVVSISGSGASGKTTSVDASGTIHPNSYNIVGTSIRSVANVSLDAATFTANLANSNVDSSLESSYTYWTYDNVGPIISCSTVSGGSGYISVPSVDILSNNMVRSLGILARMEINDGGVGYAANDKITFDNPPFCFGSGALGNVVSVNATGSITKVEFIAEPGEILGGTGYDQTNLPKANINSVYGNSANVEVTAILGDGEELFTVAEIAGAIQRIDIISGGSGYTEPPVLDFGSVSPGIGGNANVSIVTGVYSYPGRYLNDDGHLSSFNFLQDRDYYQNYSYVIRVGESFNRYRKVVRDLAHPVGMKVFGEYTFIEDTTLNVSSGIDGTLLKSSSFISSYEIQNWKESNYHPDIVNATYKKVMIETNAVIDITATMTTYSANGSTIAIQNNFDFNPEGSNLYFKFIGANAHSNIDNGIYTVTYANANLCYIETNSNLQQLITGTVHVYNPVMTFAAYKHPLNPGDRVYIQFNSNDTSLHNGVYDIAITGPYTFSIEHPYAGDIAFSFNGANVYTDIVNVNVPNHGFKVGDLAYLRFRSGDVANTTNGYTTVIGVGNSNTFNVRTTNAVMSSGNTYVHKKSTHIQCNAHGMSTNNKAYLIFDSVDSDANGLYTVTVNDANSFNVTLSLPVTLNSTARVYSQADVFANATIRRDNHNFQVDDMVFVEFNSPNISNTAFIVTDVANTNVFNIANVNVIATDVDMIGTAVISTYSS